MLYRERLSAPAWYWLVAITLSVSTVTAVGFWYGPWIAVAGGLVVIALVTVGLAWLGRTELAVDATGVRAGASVLEWPYVGAVAVLDARETRARLGVDADARAFVVQRPWLSEAVVVGVADAADPHPYWLLATRRPGHLAAAIERARAEAGA